MNRYSRISKTASYGALCIALIALGLSQAQAKSSHTGFERFPLTLPGIPAAIIPADVDADGIEDLVVVIAYTDWGEVATFEQTQFDDIEGMVEVMNVVSSLIEHRELRVYPGLAAGHGYGPPLPSLPLDTSIHALGAGHPTIPLVAITDDGISGILYDSANASEPLSIEPLIEQRSLYSDSGAFYSDLDFLFDLDNDSILDLLLAHEEGWTAYRGTESGFDNTAHPILPPPIDPEWAERQNEQTTEEALEEAEEVSSRKGRKQAKKRAEAAEEEAEDEETRPRRSRRIPDLRDLNHDDLPELVLSWAEGARGAVVYRNRGGLRFDPPIDYGRGEIHDGSYEISVGNDDEQEEELQREEFVYVGPLRKNGPAVAVTRTQLKRWDEPTFRQEIDGAKRPLFEYATHAIEPTLALGEQRATFEATGYTFQDADGDQEEESLQISLPGGFQDLDGDGLEDLVSISLDFSILPLITRALVVQSIKLTMDFNISCQQPDGTFREVENLDLSGKFKINFRKNTLRHLSQFAGDFNADGRADFVQLGRGKKVTIHHGQKGCKYPTAPDSEIIFEKKPEHLGLVRILDLNSDDRSDLYVVHPLDKPKQGRSTPVRVDLYLSGM